ncbi:MAG: IS630 family transposase [Gemmataceae bacterium]|nr:IS630 family transposase [Gemmataceae bacterium]
MPTKRYLVTLTPDEREQLDALTRAGKRSARTTTRARILLLADQAEGGPAWEDRRVAEALGCGHRTVERVRERFVTHGLDAALSHKAQDKPSRERVLDGKAEARLIAPACEEAPGGRKRWTLRMLADKLVELEVVEAVSAETVRRALKKTFVKPHLKEQWCLPGGPSAEFVSRMEDVLDVYHRPYDGDRPLVCIDEVPKQLVSEVRSPLPVRPGTPARYDYEYRREGVANLFMISEPLLGWRAVRVTERRTARDFAGVLAWVVEEVHPDADKVVLVTDNLNTHSTACLYEAFEPARARRIAERLEWHYTPKHGSWLNVAECELAALSAQCLDRRIGSITHLRRLAEAWEEERNERQVGVNWRFTTADARIKLRSLYPSIRE